MAPTILVAGATGNTGPSVVETLSSLIRTTTFSGHRILATTRSATGDVARRLAALPGVEVVEQNWVEITAEWLREQQVVRVFVAPHNGPSQFAEESAFHLAALHAGVDYVVRISTTACNVRPDYKAYYPRSHWAVEALLSSPEFSGLKWSSLQPNVFYPFVIGGAVELRRGSFAARLLLEEDLARYNGAKYVLNGPEDLTGAKLVKMVEEYIGAPVKDVVFRDMSWVDDAVANAGELKHVIASLRHAPDLSWEGKASAATTSQVVFELHPPKITAAQAFKTLLG
ncbi:NmrA-like family protein [Colletotrichum sojae]|uniref:NmrA-like family protein n=1 Tax=Colletotrichum sojae TaxID=2175907 RepID=A0A8H6ISU8_9PEZI|nr:NmrA-like family protein [Colletotrichum sojae]